MNKINKLTRKIIMSIFLVMGLFYIINNVEATTIMETTKLPTELDVIKEDSYIIGITKFYNVTMTGDRIVTATYNDSMFNWGKSEYKKPVIYFYVGNDIWYEFDENNKPTRVTDKAIKEKINNPPIYYVNNIPKMIEIKYPTNGNIKVTTNDKEKDTLVKIEDNGTILVPSIVEKVNITDSEGIKLDSYERIDNEFKLSTKSSIEPIKEPGEDVLVNNNKIIYSGVIPYHTKYDDNTGNTAGHFLGVKITEPQEYDGDIENVEIIVTNGDQVETKKLSELKDNIIWSKINSKNDNIKIEIKWDKDNIQELILRIDSSAVLEEMPKGTISWDKNETGIYDENTIMITNENITTFSGKIKWYFLSSIDYIDVPNKTAGNWIGFTIDIPDKYKNNIKEITYNIDGKEERITEEKDLTFYKKVVAGSEYEINVTWEESNIQNFIIKVSETSEMIEILLDNLKPTFIYDDNWSNEDKKVVIKYPNIEEGLTNVYKLCTQEEIESKECDTKEFTKVTGNEVEVNVKNGILIAEVLDKDKVVSTEQITIDKIDDVPPVVDIGDGLSKSTNNVTISFNVEEDNLDNITCKYGEIEGTYINDGEIEENSCSLSNLSSNKTYYYEICVTDKAGNRTCKIGSTKTENIINPDVNITYTPSNASSSTTNGYAKEAIAHVTFTNKGVTSPTYYIKSTLVGTTNINVMATCTEENNLPSVETCSENSIKNLEANTWYKVSGDINITYSEETEEGITIYAVTYDGKNFSAAGTGTTIKIDRTAPTITFGTNGNNTVAKLQSSVVTITENGSGINELKYKWSTSNEEDASNGTTFTSGDTLTTPENLNGTYYLCIYASDKVGNDSNTCSNAFKLEIPEPQVSFGTNGNNTIAKTQSSVVNITNSSVVTELKYKWSTSNTDAAKDGISFTSGNILTTPANLTGIYYLCIYIKYNNNEKSTCSNAFKLDNTGPTITFGTNGNSTAAKTQSSTITVTNDAGGAALDTSSYKYIWSTNNQATPSTTFTSGSSYTQSSGTGNYYLIAKACDTSGNCTTKTSNVFKLDNTAPSIDYEFCDDKFKFKFTVTNDAGGSPLDPSSYKYSVSTSKGILPSTRFTPGTCYSTPSKVYDRDYYIPFIACDMAGNCNDFEGEMRWIYGD